MHVCVSGATKTITMAPIATSPSTYYLLPASFGCAWNYSYSGWDIVLLIAVFATVVVSRYAAVIVVVQVASVGRSLLTPLRPST